ncbi:hypothetical protein TELCIR_10357 [Teladorsagia circumcincta]|uniref:Uncharacterized protein n=1 Tax=Teladorsagia circumcincta TaxID=45464 RepID=A0A2G9UCB5_TELCI|nr:hypothetical protein TELCIR_10357 [Teladorsagia circumcincta]
MASRKANLRGGLTLASFIFGTIVLRSWEEFEGPENEGNMDGTDVMSRFPNLPKMAEAVGNVDVVAKVESLKKWTIGTFKNSRQQLLEHMGKIDKTVDEQFEKECEELKDLHRR